jgi:hypothetical protein
MVVICGDPPGQIDMVLGTIISVKFDNRYLFRATDLIHAARQRGFAARGAAGYAYQIRCHPSRLTDP